MNLSTLRTSYFLAPRQYAVKQIGFCQFAGGGGPRRRQKISGTQLSRIATGISVCVRVTNVRGMEQSSSLEVSAAAVGEINLAQN